MEEKLERFWSSHKSEKLLLICVICHIFSSTTLEIFTAEFQLGFSTQIILIAKYFSINGQT